MLTGRTTSTRSGERGRAPGDQGGPGIRSSSKTWHRNPRTTYYVICTGRPSGAGYTSEPKIRRRREGDGGTDQTAVSGS